MFLMLSFSRVKKSPVEGYMRIVLEKPGPIPLAFAVVGTPSVAGWNSNQRCKIAKTDWHYE